jgi:hypothetical protein
MKNTIKVSVFILLFLLASYAIPASAATTFHFGAAERQLSSTTETVAAGYYDATTLHAVDNDLARGNIKKDINIFGIVGTYEGTTGNSCGLPKTGQQPGLPDGIPWRAGDDASYANPEAGGPDVGYPRRTGSWANYNTARFTTAEPVAGQVVVTDNATGLMWVSNGTSTGCYSGGTRTWAQAISFAEGLTFAGYSDWRLPNIRELQSIVDYGRTNPPINPTYFPNTASYYWSSTTSTYSTDVAWLGGGFTVSLEKGYMNGYVRPVRGNQ